MILGQTKKKESDDDQLGTESPACQITAMISDKPLPKLKIRQQKLESRKTVKKISYKIPSLQEIQSGKWLNDTHINAASYLLKCQFPSVSDLHDTRYGQDLSFPSTKSPFVQILHAENHWLTVEGVHASLVKVYDTMKYATTSDVKCQIAAIMQSSSKSITLQLEPTQEQFGDSDCGLFSIAYATELCYGNDVSSLRYYQDRLRSHLIECLKSKRMIPFPSKSCRRRKATPTILTFDVFCCCRLPEFVEEEPMAACEKCHEWYHCSCENIPSEVFNNEDVLWLCSRCTCTAM